MGWLHEIGASLVFYIFLSFTYFWHCHSTVQEKIMTAEEFAQMPNCNLAESIHNKWLQASANKDGNLYVASLNDI
jgi:hypothetical protein